MLCKILFSLHYKLQIALSTQLCKLSYQFMLYINKCRYTLASNLPIDSNCSILKCIFHSALFWDFVCKQARKTPVLLNTINLMCSFAITKQLLGTNKLSSIDNSQSFHGGKLSELWGRINQRKSDNSYELFNRVTVLTSVIVMWSHRI